MEGRLSSWHAGNEGNELGSACHAHEFGFANEA